MKSRVLVGLFVFLTLATGTAYAQTAIAGNIKAGINFATVSGDFGGPVDKGARVGGVFGAGVSVPINDRLMFDVDFLYSMEGVKATFSDPDFGSFKFTQANDYIRVPLLLRVAVGSGTRPVYVVIGPSIGFLVRARAKGEEFGEEFNEDLKDDFKKADLGLTFGAGANVNERIFVEARYTLGLTDVNAADAESDDTNRNRVFTILIGGRF